MRFSRATGRERARKEEKHDRPVCKSSLQIEFDDRITECGLRVKRRRRRTGFEFREHLSRYEQSRRRNDDDHNGENGDVRVRHFRKTALAWLPPPLRRTTRNSSTNSLMM